MIQYVITGCAGSGTGWGHRVMTELGSPCGHQRFYTTSGISDRTGFRGDSSWCAMPYVNGDLPTLVLVRNPLQVVRSISQLKPFLSDECDDPASQYVKQFHPGVYEAPDRLGRILRYVATWDRPPTGERIVTLSLESITPTRFVQTFWLLAGKRATLRETVRAMRKVGHMFNSHGGSKSTITWDQIRSHPNGWPVVDKALRWGYL